MDISEAIQSVKKKGKNETSLNCKNTHDKLWRAGVKMLMLGDVTGGRTAAASLSFPLSLILFLFQRIKHISY